MTRAFSSLGRETFVTSVRWLDGWPEIDPVQLNPRPGTTMIDEFDSADLDGEWIAVRRAPAELADLAGRPGWLVLTGDGSTMDDAHPVFVGRRQEHLRTAVTARVDASAGVGGLSLRYDERFHVDLEVGGGSVTGRAVIGGLRQEWTRPFGGGVLDLHILSGPPEPAGGFPRTSDIIRLQATIDGERIELGEVDGRFLSSETTESFTGRVIGVYAVSGALAVDRFEVEGDDE
jgi:hypothetical protein